MATSILICDDSSFARKQIARVLPECLKENVSFAKNGQEAVELIRQGKADLMFLDLNMPVMDGYEVLQAIRKDDLPTMVIVVSGDIQPEAHERVMSLGAIDFIKKPVDQDKVYQVLQKFGIDVTDTVTKNTVIDSPDIQTDQWDCYREVANVAMGQASDLLARLLNVFIQMPIPKVRTISVKDLKATFKYIDQQEQVSAVCQGFIGGGIAGEALLVFSQSSYSDIAELMNYEGEINDIVELELLMDIGSVMIGAFLKGIATQLNMSFSQDCPILMTNRGGMAKAFMQTVPKWKQVLAIEMRCSIEKHDIKCNLLLLFSEDSLNSLNEIVSILAE